MGALRPEMAERGMASGVAAGVTNTASDRDREPDGGSPHARHRGVDFQPPHMPEINGDLPEEQRAEPPPPDPGDGGDAPEESGESEYEDAREPEAPHLNCPLCSVDDFFGVPAADESRVKATKTPIRNMRGLAGHLTKAHAKANQLHQGRCREAARTSVVVRDLFRSLDLPAHERWFCVSCLRLQHAHIRPGAECGTRAPAPCHATRREDDVGVSLLILPGAPPAPADDPLAGWDPRCLDTAYKRDSNVLGFVPTSALVPVAAMFTRLLRDAVASAVPPDSPAAAMDDLGGVAGPPMATAPVIRLQLFFLLLLHRRPAWATFSERSRSRAQLAEVERVIQLMALPQYEGWSTLFIGFLVDHPDVVNMDVDEPPPPALGPAEEAPPSAGAVRRAKNKIAIGQYGKAARALDSAKVAPMNAATLGALEAIHPAPAEELVLPPDEPMPEAFIVTTEALVKQIQSFQRGSAGGPDGTQSDVIQDLLGRTGAGTRDAMIGAFRQFVQLLAQGRAPAELAPYLCGSRLIPLLKPTGGIRPIAIGVMSMRVVGKVGLDAAQEAIHAVFRGDRHVAQYGIGESGGCEAVLHALNRLVAPDDQPLDRVVMKFDAKNAFNNVERGPMLVGVRRSVPALLAMEQYKYRGSSHLYLPEGHVLLSRTGTRQGDPAAGLGFALVFRALLQGFQRIAEFEAGACILDDITVCGEVGLAAELLEYLLAQGPAVGIHIRLDKCAVWWPNALGVDDGRIPAAVPRCVDGIEMLGGVVTRSPQMFARVMQARVDKVKRGLQRAQSLAHPQHELLLLRACGGTPKVRSALGSSPSEFVAEAVADLAAAELGSLAHIMKEDLTPTQIRQARLPIADGGLGVAQAAVLGDAVYVACALRTLPLQARILGGRGIDVLPIPQFDATLARFQADHPAAPPDLPTVLLAPSTRKLQVLARIVTEKEVQGLLAQLQEARPGDGLHADRLRVARYRSVATPAASAWSLMAPRFPHESPPNRYRCALRLRLGMPVFAAGSSCLARPVHGGRPCGEVMDANGVHAFHCKVGKEGQHARHQGVVGALAAAYKRAGVPVIKDPRGMGVASLVKAGGQLRPADLLLTINGEPVCGDVSVKSPFAVGAAAWRAEFVVGATAEKGHADKVVKHAAACTAMGVGFKALSFDIYGNPSTEMEKDLAWLVMRVAEHEGVRPAVASALVRRRVGWAVMMGTVAQVMARKDPDVFV